jgi:hypothetical protein
MKTLIALAAGVGALGLVAAASPAFAQDTAVPPGYVTGSPGYVAPGYAAPGYATPGFGSGPFGILALPFQIAAAPFQMFQPANGAIAPSPGTPLVPVNPSCGVWHDWNGRYTATCGL